ncbi:hypothetical protein ACFV8Z_28490 [Streptomyces sp. NPDC059837]|uniref:hypothetical protein n=1 Tax=Streptomyces sp. NPDC059837 TaxID=3346968 RepID=UPI00364CE979
MRSGAVLATTVLALGGSLASSPVAEAAASPPAQHHSAHGTASVTRVLTLPTAAGKPIAATVETGPDRLGPARPGVPAAAAARKWHYRSVRATLCMLNKKPYWGGPKNTPSSGVGYASLAGEVAYNGKYVWGAVDRLPAQGHPEHQSHRRLGSFPGSHRGRSAVTG